MNKDEDILYYLSECPILSRKQLGRLTRRNNSWLHESLQRLVDQKVLYYKDRGKFLPFLYAAYDIRDREYFIHDEPISEIYTVLKSTGRVWEWNQPRQKFNEEVNQDVSFYWRVPKTPKGDKIKYYLEFETGKNKTPHIKRKLDQYTEMRKHEAFQVIFVLRDERIKELSDYIKLATPYVDKSEDRTWKRFLFTMYNQIVVNPLGSIFQIPYGMPVPLSKDLLE